MWGYRLLGHRRLSRERLRVLLWLIGAVLAAAFASCLPRSAHWPLPSGLGGVIGDAMLRLPVVLLHMRRCRREPPRSRRIVLGIAALVAFAGAAGAIWRDASEETRPTTKHDRGDETTTTTAAGSRSASGASLLSFRARLARLFGRRPRAPMPARDETAMPRRRIEPRFDDAGGAVRRRTTTRKTTPKPRRARRASRARRKRAPLRQRLRSAAARIF